MASILDRYGIKEVADVTFYEINSDGSRGNPVLYLDTLKVSTIEQTADNTEARGGKGNPALISWDYGKEINVTLEDALFSPKSMAVMFGNGKASAKTASTVTRTVAAIIRDGGDNDNYIDFFTVDVYDAVQGAVRSKIDMMNSSTPRAGMIKFADAKITVKAITKENGDPVSDPTPGVAGFTFQEIASAVADMTAGEKVFLTYEQNVLKSEVVISGDSFPGTYYITGDTYARSDVTGKDDFFQFIIPKAKVQAENTITLEAEGDPSVFNMSLKVLRPDDGDMMKLVQYNLSAN